MVLKLPFEKIFFKEGSEFKEKIKAIKPKPFKLLFNGFR
jgi:hypothetical protein